MCGNGAVIGIVQVITVSALQVIHRDQIPEQTMQCGVVPI
jgi:hypothetical protein